MKLNDAMIPVDVPIAIKTKKKKKKKYTAGKQIGKKESISNLDQF